MADATATATATAATSTPANRSTQQPNFSVYHFCVAYAPAREVYVIGDFNNWSTTATPMTETEPGTWQLSLLMRGGQPPDRFAFFVIAGSKAVRSPFSTSVLPGCWAAVEESAPGAFRAHAASLRARAICAARKRR